MNMAYEWFMTFRLSCEVEDTRGLVRRHSLCGCGV